MFNYIIAKYYDKMIAMEDEHPVLRTIVYTGAVLFLLLFSLSLPIFTLIERLGLKNRSDRTLEIATLIGATVLIPLLLYYYLIRKKHLEKIVIKYGDRKMNSIALNILLFLIPMLLLLIGPAVTVWLFGGTMLNHEIKGFLTPYLHGQ